MNTPTAIEISEHTNTWGCYWQEPGNDERHYGFQDLPRRVALWLFDASGNAVQAIIDAKLGAVIRSVKGAYGGEKRTVSVNVAELEKACNAYWDRLNAAYEREQERTNTCHYCGGEAVSTDFFDAPVCNGCGGR